MNKKIHVGIVGLGFGKEFIPIYQAHPDAEMYAICQRTPDKLEEVGNQFGVARRYTSFDELIADPNLDAVHINSPIHLHAPQSIAALKAGKHVACTVPAATSVEECAAIVAAAQESGKNYMMMETAIYTREFLFVREMEQTGQLGRIQFLRGCHQQEMAGWPGYWEGLPPMHYATHAVSPCLALVRGQAGSVSCAAGAYSLAACAWLRRYDRVHHASHPPDECLTALHRRAAPPARNRIFSSPWLAGAGNQVVSQAGFSGQVGLDPGCHAGTGAHFAGPALPCGNRQIGNDRSRAPGSALRERGVRFGA